MKNVLVKKIINDYISEVNNILSSGDATEHSFRSALETMLCKMIVNVVDDEEGKRIHIINEPKRKEFGAPDFELRRGVHILSFIETKTINDTDLRGNKTSRNKKQFDRYKSAISLIAFTDFLHFILYENGEEIMSARIGILENDTILPIQDELEMSKMENLVERLALAPPQPITSATQLAKMMAGKAKLLALLIEQHLKANKESGAIDDWDHTSELRSQYESFRIHLIEGLAEKDFADIYAQTIAYGLFAARLNSLTPETFTRTEIPLLIPQSSPFLRSIFSNMAGADLDENVSWVVDDLAKTIKAMDVKKVMRTHYNSTKHYDPLLHFYEDFLAAYDPVSRKEKGVWYTPSSIVTFMTRAVDEILQRDFGIDDGLADSQTIDRENKSFHRVQILDPATGTGTFLAEIINLIYDRYRSQPGLWQQYVEKCLLPRLNGFELLMAPYAIAHLKIDMVLQKTGYKERSHQRFRIFLTNSLEDQKLQPISLFDYKLARESNQANAIKRKYPVMVMIGNPPYNNSSSNKGKWILSLIQEYKKGVEAKKLNLDDDYVKFIRLGQYYIARNGEGVLAFVTNNNFLDAITFWQMRKSLLASFDDIYILNLHGNSKNLEKSPDGTRDENIFGIRQGTSINIFVKKTGNKEMAQVHYLDLYGKKKDKLQFLEENSLTQLEWTSIHLDKTYFFFTPKEFELKEEYEKGFCIDHLFRFYNSGLQTKRDNLNIFFSDRERMELLHNFKENDLLWLAQKYKFHDNRDWQGEKASNDLKCHPVILTRVNYRPFDDRFTNYTGVSRGIMGYPRKNIAVHLRADNMLLITSKQQSSFQFQHVFVTRLISDMNSISAQSKEQSYMFPLYLYGENGVRLANIDSKIAERIAHAVNLTYQEDPMEKAENVLSPEMIFDYVYAILHSPQYRERYKEMLKIGFPQIPFPSDKQQFIKLVELGGQLRNLHLMEHLPSSLNALEVNYMGDGDHIVGPCKWEDEKVWINATNHFQGVEEDVWSFYIGGYQPLQKWLQYRKGRKLEASDIIHFEKMAYCIRHTIMLMREIDIITTSNNLQQS